MSGKCEICSEHCLDCQCNYPEKSECWIESTKKTRLEKLKENDYFKGKVNAMLLDFTQELSRNDITKDEKTLADILKIIDKFVDERFI